MCIINYSKIDNFISYYYCPLGHNKFKISTLKTNETNLKLIKMVELKNNDKNAQINNLKRIAEDSEYEYYVKKV